MKKTFTKLLLLGVMCLIGGNAWAYDIPDGLVVRKVIVGALNQDGTVSPETFESGTFDNNIWNYGTCYHSNVNERMKLVDLAEVAKPEIDASVESGVVPTYVGGKVLQFHSRSNATQYGVLKTGNVSSGKLVLSVDMNFGGQNKNNAPYIIFMDSEGNQLLSLGYSCGQGEKEYFTYNGTNDGTVSSSKLRDKYTGHAIKDIVIDLESGSVIYTVDCINENGVRKVMTTTKEINIGTGKTISEIRFSRNFAASSQSNYIWLDNVECYVVGEELPSHNYTVNAVCGSTILQQLTTGSIKEEETYGYNGLPYVIQKDGQFYVLNDNQATNFSKSFVMGTDDAVVSVNYTLDNTIVGYSEVGTGDEPNYSGGGMGPTTSKLATSTVASGIYRAEIKVISKAGNGSNHRTEGVYVGENEIARTINGNKLFSFTFPVFNDNTEVYVRGKGTNNYSDNLDYVLIRKLADYPVSGDDVTFFIENPSFESGTVNSQNNVSGWVATGGMKIQNNTSFAKVGTNYAESWQPSATTDINQTITNLPAGTYRLSAIAKARGVQSAKLYANTNETAMTIADEHNTYTVEFVLDGETDLKIGAQAVGNGATSSWFCIDDFHLTYIAPLAASVTVPANTGMTTFCSPYTLDFTEAENIKAYEGRVVGSKVTLSPINVVPANTGVLLVAEGGATENIPVTTEATELDDNQFVGVLTETEITSSTPGTNYVLAYDGTSAETIANTIGFYNIGATSATVPAGKAYLKVPVVGINARLSIEFGDGELTGIEANDAEEVEETEGEAINLSGLPVNASFKGIMIKNGQKIYNK